MNIMTFETAFEHAVIVSGPPIVLKILLPVVLKGIFMRFLIRA